MSVLSRRNVLKQSAVGFGYLAAMSMLQDERAAQAAVDPLAPKQPHFPARAKRVIFLFMKGGPSQVDTFDYKPELQTRDGQELPFDKPRVQFAATGKLLKSPWQFRQHGESGLWVSELFPNVAKHVDDLCVLSSCHGTNAAHGGALLKLHTGSDNFLRPSMGAWVSYGLGTENRSLPAFVTICPTLAHGGVKNWGSAFLPAWTQGTPIGNASVPAENARVKFITTDRLTRDEQRRRLDLLAEINRQDLEQTGPNAALEARISSFELAFRMQGEMPRIQDLSDESKSTIEAYGINDKVTSDFGRQCLMARRFSERGVRFVQVTHSDDKVQWDQHGNLRAGHAEKASEVDRPIAALLADLKARGMLDDTLVMWGGEFGRTPVAQGKDGRDHNPEGFTMWMAGAGVKRGFKYGSTDEFGYYAIENKMHVNDLHATLLHLLGMDHLRLTYRYAGRDFRLTDIAGHVAHGILA